MRENNCGRAHFRRPFDIFSRALSATLAPFFDETFSPQAFISKALSQSSSVLERLESALAKVEHVLRAKVCFSLTFDASVCCKLRLHVCVRECIFDTHSIFVAECVMAR